MLKSTPSRLDFCVLIRCAFLTSRFTLLSNTMASGKKRSLFDAIGDASVVEMESLVRQGADINAASVEDKNKFTPLQYAANEGEERSRMLVYLFLCTCCRGSGP